MGVTLKPILDKPKADGTCQVYIRVIVDRVVRKAATGIFILPKHFNPKGTYNLKNWIRTNHDLQETYNKQIKNYLDKASKGVQKAQGGGLDITADLVRDLILSREKADIQTFSAYYTQVCERYHTPEQNRTYEKYFFALEKLHKFNGGKEVKFSGLTVAFIEKFYKWLMTDYKDPKTGQPNKLNTASKTLAFLRTITKQAVKDKKLRFEDDPFLHVPLKSEKSNKTKLTLEEIQQFQDLDIPPNIKAWHVRNIFMMQLYLAGSRIGDMLLLQFDFVQDGRVIFHMEKTGTQQSLKLHKKALDIINMYRALRPGAKYVFPFLNEDTDYRDLKTLQDTLESHTAYINKLLKVWFKKAGVDKNVSTHVARHSFTNIARRSGASLYDISKSLRHSSLKITEVYLENFDDGAVDRVIDSVFDGGEK